MNHKKLLSVKAALVKGETILPHLHQLDTPQQKYLTLGVPPAYSRLIWVFFTKLLAGVSAFFTVVIPHFSLNELNLMNINAIKFLAQELLIVPYLQQLLMERNYEKTY